VDQDPSVKRSSAKFDQNEFRKIVQGQVVLSAIRSTLMEWSVNWMITHEATNFLHDHNDVCTYNKIFNHIQRGNKE
jgi:hypothetical protein